MNLKNMRRKGYEEIWREESAGIFCSYIHNPQNNSNLVIFIIFEFIKRLVEVLFLLSLLATKLRGERGRWGDKSLAAHEHQCRQSSRETDFRG